MDKNKERMEREKVITLLRLVKENGLKIDIAADEICSLFNVVGQSEQLVCDECGGEGERWSPYYSSYVKCDCQAN